MFGRGRPRPPRWTWDTLLTSLASSCRRDQETGCLLWQEGVDKNGYPKLMIDRKHWRGNRAVMFAVTKQLGPMALHSCHRPRCLESGHLRWGTASENAQDMWDSGRASMNLRHHSGSANGRSKLTEQQRQEIVARRLAGEPRKLLAKEYGVSESTVAAVTHAAGAGIPTGRGKRHARLRDQEPQ